MTKNEGEILEEHVAVEVGAPEGVEFRVTEVVATYSYRLSQPGGYDNAQASYTIRVQLGPEADPDEVIAWVREKTMDAVREALRGKYRQWYKKPAKGGQNE